MAKALEGRFATSRSGLVYTLPHRHHRICKLKLTLNRPRRRKALRLLHIDIGQSIAIDGTRVLRD
jgi:hypothetical protein